MLGRTGVGLSAVLVLEPSKLLLADFSLAGVLVAEVSGESYRMAMMPDEVSIVGRMIAGGLVVVEDFEDWDRLEKARLRPKLGLLVKKSMVDCLCRGRWCFRWERPYLSHSQTSQATILVACSLHLKYSKLYRRSQQRSATYLGSKPKDSQAARASRCTSTRRNPNPTH
jgi:hypothetical protein